MLLKECDELSQHLKAHFDQMKLNDFQSYKYFRKIFKSESVLKQQLVQQEMVPTMERLMMLKKKRERTQDKSQDFHWHLNKMEEPVLNQISQVTTTILRAMQREAKRRARSPRAGSNKFQSVVGKLLMLQGVTGSPRKGAASVPDKQTGAESGAKTTKKGPQSR